MDTKRVAMRAKLLDEALEAHAHFQTVVTERAKYPLNDYVARLEWPSGGALIAEFKTFRLYTDVRPVLAGADDPAMEYTFYAMASHLSDSRKEVLVGTMYLLPRIGTLALDCMGVDALGNATNWRVVDAVGAWLSGQVEQVGLLRPRVVPKAGFVEFSGDGGR